MGSFRRILVGWDGSRDAEAALRAAGHLASDLEGEVLVLSVMKAHKHAEAADEEEEDMAARREEALSDIEGTAKKVISSPELRLRSKVVEAEHPAEALSNYAREHGFDLIVVGRHGLDQAVRPHVGGFTEHQVRHSPCPVLVVGTDR